MGGRSRIQRISALRRTPSEAAPATPVPLTIPGLAIWYDASASPGVDGQAVAGLVDQSGYHRDASATNGSPTWSSSGFGAGRPAVVCSADAEFTLTGSPLVLTGGCACFAVVDRPTGAMFFAVDPVGITGLLLYNDGHVYVSDDASQLASGAYSATGPLIVRWLRGSTGWVFRGTGLSADAIMPGVLGPLTVSSFVHRGGTGDGPGDDAVAELLIYDQAVSDSDRTSLEGYLSAKWACPL